MALGSFLNYELNFQTRLDPPTRLYYALQVPTIKEHKGSIKRPLEGLGIHGRNPPPPKPSQAAS